jgi:ketol-acid reductoisomerase
MKRCFQCEDYKKINVKTKTIKMAKLNFGGVEENVVTREEFPLAKAQQVLKDEVVAVIGYGVQGPGQALNQKENGVNVIVGQRKNSKSWDKAVRDGFVPGETLFEIEDALQRGTIICYLLSDAAQIAMWPTVKKHLTPGKALYFSHGFGITYKEKTGIIPPADVDVFLVAPKGSGTSLRRMFLQGRGLNSSYAIFQDATGRAFERVVALGIAIGSGYLFETDFRKEVYSDLTGERGTLMGAIQGIFAAQFEVLRSKGHSPSEAFNETVEELTQSLMPLVAENGMDWMYANCSTTAQRGALDWWKRFRDVTKPVFNELYESVAEGKEAAKSIESNSKADYREKLEDELKELRDSELWQAGKTVRSLRPENQAPEKKAETNSLNKTAPEKLKFSSPLYND